MVRICDAERRTLSRGEIGDLYIGGPSVIEHYLHNDQATGFYHDESGSWLITGDLALIYETGMLFFLGRSKDIIKKTGMSLSPTVIESTLNRNLGMRWVVDLCGLVCSLADRSVGRRDGNSTR